VKILTEKTSFGKEVLKKLVDVGKNQKWLQDEITAKTGLYVDSSYMNKALTGKYVSPKLVEAIREILDLPDPVNKE
jgi:hypothetical protein